MLATTTSLRAQTSIAQNLAPSSQKASKFKKLPTVAKANILATAKADRIKLFQDIQDTALALCAGKTDTSTLLLLINNFEYVA